MTTEEKQQTPARILRLEASNVKRLTAVSITPEGDVVVIGGRNGAGKSSVLDAIEWALHGRKAIQSQPLRRGADKGETVVELSNGLLVRRAYTAAGGTSLTVSDQEGRNYRSPQAVLDAFYDELSFDPLAFSRLKPAEQRDSLQKLVGLDFSELNQRRTAVYDERTQTNRDVKALRVQLDQMPRHDDVPAEEVSLSALIQTLDEANAHNVQLEAQQKALHDLKNALVDCTEDIAKLEERLAEARRNKSNLEQRIEAAEKALAPAPGSAAAGGPIDTSQIRQSIEDAEAVNKKVRENQARSKMEARLQQAEEQSAALTDQIDQIDAEKARQLAAATMPIEDLAFDDSGVTYKGVPFDQCSSAEQLRVSAAMGMAMSPNLRVMLIRDGSLMDDESMAALAALAEENDYQVFVERVGASGQVIIEDGQVLEQTVSGSDDQAESSDPPA